MNRIYSYDLVTKEFKETQVTKEEVQDIQIIVHFPGFKEITINRHHWETHGSWYDNSIFYGKTSGALIKFLTWYYTAII